MTPGLLKEYQVHRFLAFTDPDARPARRRLQRRAGPDRGRQRRPLRPGTLRRLPDPLRLRARAAHRLHLHRRGRGARPGRRRRPDRAAGVVIWRALAIASQTDDVFGRVAAAGIACWFGFQAFQNIGMCLGIMPVTGVPLPFVSYGGSSMFAGMLALGLLQNIHLRSTASLPTRFTTAAPGARPLISRDRSAESPDRVMARTAGPAVHGGFRGAFGDAPRRRTSARSWQAHEGKSGRGPREGLARGRARARRQAGTRPTPTSPCAHRRDRRPRVPPLALRRPRPAAARRRSRHPRRLGRGGRHQRRRHARPRAPRCSPGTTACPWPRPIGSIERIAALHREFLDDPPAGAGPAATGSSSSSPRHRSRPARRAATSSCAAGRSAVGRSSPRRRRPTWPAR